MPEDRPTEKRCRALISVRDTYRYTGRGKTGFELYYKHRQCKRLSVIGSEFCRQHIKFHREGVHAK